MDKQAKNNKKCTWLTKRFLRIPLGWQIVIILLVAVGAFAAVRFTVGIVEDVYDDITGDLYYVSVEMGDYEVHSYYGGADYIVKHGRLFPVLGGLDNVENGDADSLWLVSKDDRYSYFDVRNGKLMTPFIYTKAWSYSEGVAAVVDEDGVLRFINVKGEPAFERTFDYNQGLNYDYQFHHQMCQMPDTTGKVGMIDMTGKWVVEPEYDSAAYTGGYWTLMRGDSLLVIDSTRRTLIDMTPGHQLRITEDGSIEIWHRMLPGRLYNTDGNLQASQTYWRLENMTYYDDDESVSTDVLVYYTEYDRCGLLSKDGRILTDARYEGIEALDKALFRAKYRVNDDDYNEYDYTSIYVLLNGEW